MKKMERNTRKHNSGTSKCISKNQWFSREPPGASESIPFTWKLINVMGWDGERAGLWNIGLTDTEGFISKESLWVESWMTRGTGSISVSEQYSHEGITSLLFPFGECFKTSAIFSNTNMCPSWVTHMLQFLTSRISLDSWVSLCEGLSQWQVIFDRFEKPGKENKLFSRVTKISHLFKLLHPEASGKKRLSTPKIY